MGRKRNTLEIGRTFGRLTVIGSADPVGRNSASLCRCKCGREKIIMNLNLLSGDSTSCGCLAAEKASERVKRNPPRLLHGCSKTITYSSWQSMVNRCNNPESSNYSRYGGSGVVVSSRWSDPKDGFKNFLEDMGERPSKDHSIDRIDGNGDYEPGNCRWATRVQQNQNVGLKASNTSGYKGICKFRNAWKAEIRSNGIKTHLGVYETAEEAAFAYNVASNRLHGPYGVRNTLPRMTKSVRTVVIDKVISTLAMGE